MNTSNRLSLCVLAALSVSASCQAELDVSGSILAFGDLYYIPEHHIEAADGDFDAWLRRVYVTVDVKDEDNNLSYRARSESNELGNFGDREIKTRIKDLWGA